MAVSVGLQAAHQRECYRCPGRYAILIVGAFKWPDCTAASPQQELNPSFFADETSKCPRLYWDKLVPVDLVAEEAARKAALDYDEIAADLFSRWSAVLERLKKLLVPEEYIAVLAQLKAAGAFGSEQDIATSVVEKVAALQGIDLTAKIG